MIAKAYQHNCHYSNTTGAFVETIFAVLENGTIITSGVRRYSNSLRLSKKWKKVDAIPEGAEFIGHYSYNF